MQIRLRRVLVLLGLALTLAFPPSGWAQAPEAQEEPEENAAPRPERTQDATSRAETNARVQALRQQLTATKDGNERRRLHGELISTLAKAGQVVESLKARDDLLEDNTLPPGRRSLEASSLALSYAYMGDYPKSQRAIQRARQLAKDTRADEYESLTGEPAYAFLRAEAEIARRSQGRHDVALLRTRERAELAWSNFNDASLTERRRQAAANELFNTVYIYVVQLVQNNRREEALSYATGMQQRLKTRPDLRPTANQRGTVQMAMAVALSSHDDYDAALTQIDAAIAGLSAAGGQDHDVQMGTARRLRLLIALAMDRIPDYRDDGDRLQRGRATNPVLDGAVGRGEAESLTFASRGQWVEAATRLGSEMAINLRWQGADTPFYLYRSAMQMLYRLNDKAQPVSLGEIERFVARLSGGSDDWVDGNYRAAYVADGALAKILDLLVPKGQAPAPDAANLAFRVAEFLHGNASQGALADGAARLAASDPKLRALVEQEQRLRFEQNTSQRAFAAAADRIERVARQGAADEAVQKRRVADLAEKEQGLAASNARLVDLRRQIAAAFPTYRELISPRIPTAAALGAALRPGEAYVDFYAGQTGAYAFVVQPGGGLRALRIDTTRAETKKKIAALRAPFDAGLPPEKAADRAGFDLDASYTLYNTWLAPLQEALRGARTVYIAGGGVLSNLPWNVLVTQPATRLDQAKWWITQATPVEMPGGSSLVLARSHGASKAKSAFAAFADPSFDGRDTPASPAPGTRTVRQNAVSADLANRPAPDYRAITPLPETLDEARAIGGTLGADAGSVLRGVKASRSQVLQQDLSNTRVVAFATHGLLPGELPDVPKAGLAMAYEGRGWADSVLTIDEIVGLRLDADWVILSACNTGYATGEAGDSMSALIRGFFAAGARTLLTTLWAVESQSAKELTVQTFKALTLDPTLDKAQALAASQRDMLAGKFGALYRHPYFWAPYFLAGDAAR